MKCHCEEPTRSLWGSQRIVMKDKWIIVIVPRVTVKVTQSHCHSTQSHFEGFGRTESSRGSISKCEGIQSHCKDNTTLWTYTKSLWRSHKVIVRAQKVIVKHTQHCCDGHKELWWAHKVTVRAHKLLWRSHSYYDCYRAILRFRQGRATTLWWYINHCYCTQNHSEGQTVSFWGSHSHCEGHTELLWVHIKSLCVSQ